MPDESAAPDPSKPFPKRAPSADPGTPTSDLIDRRIAELNDWRGTLLARLRATIRAAVALNQASLRAKARRAS